MCSNMPSVGDNWIENPLGVVDRLFGLSRERELEGEERSQDWGVEEYFRERFLEKNAWAWVPSINDVPLHLLKPNGLVRYRCMVQDMFDPEYYLERYETIVPTTKEKTFKSGKFRDVTECSDHEVSAQSPGSVISERQTFYCVPIPGESDWAKEAYRQQSRFHPQQTTPELPKLKRSIDAVSPDDSKEGEEPMEADEGNGDASKRRRLAENEASRPQLAHHDLNFPLPGEKGPACLVKMYGEVSDYKVNEMLEVYGILSVDPVLAQLASSDERNADGIETREEVAAHSPPPSLVPRIHVILTRRLRHTHPLIGNDLTSVGERVVAENIASDVSRIREEFIKCLSRLLMGDELAAEYFLLHLLSGVHARKDSVALGKFSLGLTGCPSGIFTQKIYGLVNAVTPKNFFLSLTLENLNSFRFRPKKDYAANCLKSGILQLTDDTSLVLDETALAAGQLDTEGVRNLTALGNVLRWQKVEYDFSYHSADFLCNIVVLALSEGKSLLPVDCSIPLRMTTPDEDVAISEDVLQKFRLYLGLMKRVEYKIAEEQQQMVQDDFVAMRREDPDSVNGETLHHLLNVARLLSLSVGQRCLTGEMWGRAKILEEARKARIA